MQVWQKGKAKYILFVFVFFVFPGRNKRKQPFSSYCKWCDLITFVVTKFGKKNEGTKKAN